MNPDLNVGFHATDTLGLNPPLNGVYGYLMLRLLVVSNPIVGL
jgi:hypothetical protein